MGVDVVSFAVLLFFSSFSIPFLYLLRIEFL